eukprot:GHVU01064332.1.p1 GENE.GHVU01064332.1~~GHVU01064332.1.p1  ORF type:complete len:227 (+),score=24.03 GHVU01064332.1:59-739(+)
MSSRSNDKLIGYICIFFLSLQLPVESFSGSRESHLSRSTFKEPASFSVFRPASSATGASGEENEEWRGAEAISALTHSMKRTVFDIEAIKEILPHRYPFLLVDKVLEFQPGSRAVGVKQVSSNEVQFNGHFPSRAIMPGVLMIEAMAQLGGIVCLQEPVSNGEGNFFFAGVDGVKWKRPVVPGDTLVMEMELKTWKPKFGIAKMSGKAFVDGVLAVDVESFTFALA